jgi:hypothetical protein
MLHYRNGFYVKISRTAEVFTRAPHEPCVIPHALRVTLFSVVVITD